MQVEEITRSEFARRLGVSAARVSQVADQRLSDRARRGRKILWPIARDEWHGGKDPGQQLREEPVPAADAPEEPVDSTGYREAKTRAALAQAERQEMELAKAKGELISRRQVEEAMVAAGRRLRDRIGRIELMADELAEVCGVDAAQVRPVLRKFGRDLAGQLADVLTAEAEEAESDAA